MDDFSKYVQDKRDLYEAVQRNGWYVPSLKSNACNEKFLKKVFLGKTWCPKYEDIKILPCPRPPPKTVLYEKFKTIMNTKKFPIGFDDKHLPDAKWLLTVIATLNPGDEIFKKSYVPPPKESKISQIEAIEIPEHFLKDLPPSRKKVKRRGLMMVGEGLQQQKLVAMKEKVKALNIKILLAQGDQEEQKVRSQRNEKSPVISKRQQQLLSQNAANESKISAHSQHQP